MAQTIKIKRTPFADRQPPPFSLEEGELAAEMAGDVPRLWLGVPTDINATGRRLVVGPELYPPAGLFLPIAGGTMYNAGGGSPLLTLRTDVTQDDYIRFQGSRDWLFGAQAPSGLFLLYDQSVGGGAGYRWAVDPLGRILFYGPIDIGPYGGQRQAWIDSTNGYTAFGSLQIGNIDGVGPPGRIDLTGSARFTVDLDVDQDIRAHRNLSADGFVGSGGNVHCGWDCLVNASLIVNAGGTFGGGVRITGGELRVDGALTSDSVAGTRIYAPTRFRVDQAIDWGSPGNERGYVDCTNGNAYFAGVFRTGGRADFDGNIDGWGVAVNNGGLWMSERCDVGSFYCRGYAEVSDFRSNQNVFVPYGYIHIRQTRIEQGGAGQGYDVDPGLVINRYDEEPGIRMNNVGIREWDIRVRRDGYFLIGRPGIGGYYTVHPDNGFTVINGSLHVLGDLAVNGSYPSDLRLKQNVAPYARGLADITKLQPISFEWNGKGQTLVDGRRHFGVDAAAAEAAIPEMVGRRVAPFELDDPPNTEILNIDPHAVTFALVNAVKELAAANSALEQRVRMLEGRH